METRVIKRDEQPGEIQTVQSNPIATLLTRALEKGVTTENTAALKDLMALYKDMESVTAKKAFASAKAALQAELPFVTATKPIPSKDGTVRSTFAPYEEIMAKVGPFLTKHGFSVSFNIRVEPDGKRLCAICTLAHVSGHSESNEFAVRIGNGPPGCSEAQADGAARSYARRGALCDALNIVVDHDTDARQEGDYITQEQADSLRRRVEATGADESRFFGLADADSYETIRTSKYAALDAALTRKERTAKQQQNNTVNESDIDRAFARK